MKTVASVTAEQASAFAEPLVMSNFDENGKAPWLRVLEMIAATRVALAIIPKAASVRVGWLWALRHWRNDASEKERGIEN